MNKKGFSLVELLLFIAILGFVIPSIFAFMEDEDIAQKTGNFVKEFKQEAKPEVKVKTITVDRSGVKCIDGRKAIEIDNTIYYIGTLDTWGDIKGIECQ